MFRRKTPQEIETERKKLEAEIKEHKKNIADMEAIVHDRKKLEELESTERRERIVLEHPTVFAAVHRLRSLLGSTNRTLKGAKNRYKRYVKKHPYQSVGQ